MAFVLEVMSIRQRAGCEFKFVPRPQDASDEEYIAYGRQFGRELGETVLRGADLSLVGVDTGENWPPGAGAEVSHVLSGRVLVAEQI